MRAFLAMIILLIAPATAQAQTSERKVALVIANATYSAAGTLINPPNDARLVGDAARRAGFEVVFAQNADLAGFQRALRDFRTKADGARVAMVYYAGHGIEGSGKNWLIPVDAKLENNLDLPYEAIELERVMDSMSGAQVRMVVLDACRNNPFGRTWRSATRSVQRGLAGIEFDDVLVIYAAAPGQTASDGDGANSPFAASLAKRLVEPDLPVQLLGGTVRDDVLNATGGSQRPFVSSSITGTPIYLVPRAKQGSATAAVAAPTTDSATLDALAWQGALGAQSVAAFEEYKFQFPNGRFVRLADQNIARLSTAAPQVNASPPSPAVQSDMVPRGYLGLQIQPVNEDVASSLGLAPNRGELVARVEPGQGAAQAGLAQGDVVLSVDGKEVSSAQTLSFLIANTTPGDRVVIGGIRNGQRFEVTALVGPRPSEEALAARNPSSSPASPNTSAGLAGANLIDDGVIQQALGFEVIGMSQKIAGQLGRPDSKGVVVTRVDQSSDAGAKGLARGDVILSVNNSPVGNIQDFETALRAAQGSDRPAVLLSVGRGSRPPVYLAVKLR